MSTLQVQQAAALPLLKSTLFASPTSSSRLSMSSSSSSTSLFYHIGVSLQNQQRPPPNNRVPKIAMRIASPGSKQSYICRDCGYIYSDRTPFDKLPDKYFCPVCGAPKRRFKPYQPVVAKNANQTDARKARKEQLKQDESTGKLLPIVIAVGIVALAGLYYYINSAY